MSSKSEVSELSGGQKPPIRGLHVSCDAHFRTRMSYSSQKPCVKIWFGLVQPFKSYHLNFTAGGGGGGTLLGGYMWPVMPIFELGWAIPVKRHMWKFGSDWLSLSRVIVSTNIFLGGRNPLLGGGGLHLTCDAHFWTQMSYSSQKSCVEIWFGLVEIRDMLMLRGAEDPLLGGYIWPAMPIFELGRGFLDKSHVWKFGSDWLRLSRVIVGTNQMDHVRGQTKTTPWTRKRTKIFIVTCRSPPIGALNIF